MLRTNASRIGTADTLYDPWGDVWTGNDQWSFGYTGHINDAATGLIQMQQRYYDPLLGRFVSADPELTKVKEGSNFNKFWYANNNPYRYTDPDGRYIETAWDALSISVGANSFVGNYSSGNYFAAAVDAGGIVFDAVAAAIPLVPGGAGIVISAARNSDSIATIQK